MKLKTHAHLWYFLRAGTRLPFGQLLFETLAIRDLPFGTVAIRDTCHSGHLPCDSCHSGHLPFGRVAIRPTCHLGHLPFGTLAIRDSCHSKTLAIQTLAIQRHLPFKHLPFGTLAIWARKFKFFICFVSIMIRIEQQLQITKKKIEKAMHVQTSKRRMLKLYM